MVDESGELGLVKEEDQQKEPFHNELGQGGLIAWGKQQKCSVSFRKHAQVACYEIVSSSDYPVKIECFGSCRLLLIIGKVSKTIFRSTCI